MGFKSTNKITLFNLKQIIKEELQDILREERGDGDAPRNKEFLDGIVESLLDKGYQRMEALPRRPGLTGDFPKKHVGRFLPPIKVIRMGYAITFPKQDIVLIMTEGIKGRSEIGWTVEEKEFKQLVGTDPCGGDCGLVYAVMVKPWEDVP